MFLQLGKLLYYYFFSVPFWSFDVAQLMACFLFLFVQEIPMIFSLQVTVHMPSSCIPLSGRLLQKYWEQQLENTKIYDWIQCQPYAN
jgi:hypothetical protein